MDNFGTTVRRDTCPTVDLSAQSDRAADKAFPHINSFRDSMVQPTPVNCHTFRPRRFVLRPIHSQESASYRDSPVPRCPKTRPSASVAPRVRDSRITVGSTRHEGVQQSGITIRHLHSGRISPAEVLTDEQFR
jgi:hypothetical protein